MEFNLTENLSFPFLNTYLDITDQEIWNHVIQDFENSQFTLNAPSTIILLVLYVPIFITSLVGNSLVLLVILPNQRMWNVTNNFLVNLAVADLLGK